LLGNPGSPHGFISSTVLFCPHGFRLNLSPSRFLIGSTVERDAAYRGSPDLIRSSPGAAFLFSVDHSSLLFPVVTVGFFYSKK